jgi:hypothetical protein
MLTFGLRTLCGLCPCVAESFARKERSACKTRSACPRRAPFAEGHALALGGRRDM